MQLEFLTQNISNAAVIIPAILKEWSSYYEEKAFKEYYPQFHKVNNYISRPKKVIVKPDPYGVADKFGNVPNVTVFQDLNRVSLALQKLIVSRKTAFVTGGTVNLKSKPLDDTEQRMYDEVQAVWRQNKLQFRNADLFKKLASETECCEIWYSVVNGTDVKMKMNIFSPQMGYELIPVFDNTQDLIAFGLKYQVKNGTETTNKLDLYDSEKITKYTQNIGYTWTIENVIKHAYGKIPVIYYNIGQSVWQDVQNMIERLEFLMSNFADTNDYNGSPILFAEGEITGWADKGESGKVIQGNGGAKLSYVNWDSAPQSIRMEIEKLLDFIYTITQTPNISFQEMKGIGGNISGAAWDRIMIDAHLNAMDFHNGAYGEGIQRRVNFIKNALAAIDNALNVAVDLEITPVFSLFSIDDKTDRIDTAMKANGGKPVMSQKESIQYAGVSDDPEKTLTEINAEPIIN